MARTIEQIQQEIFQSLSNEAALAELNSPSKVAFFKLWVYIVAFVVHIQEKIFDTHTKEVDHLLSEKTPHTHRWYRNKALEYQHGVDLIEDTDKFNNENLTEEQISNSKIIKYSAVTENSDQRVLQVKIATEVNGVLSPISQQQFTSFKAYINEVKDAGVAITVTNYLPDLLRLNIEIIRDRLVIDENGMNILTGTFPVNDVINEFLKKLPFNGELSIQKLEASILAVDGVKDLSLNSAETTWIDGATNSYGNYELIHISQIPVSGYYAVNLTGSEETKSTIVYA